MLAFQTNVASLVLNCQRLLQPGKKDQKGSSVGINSMTNILALQHEYSAILSLSFKYQRSEN